MIGRTAIARFTPPKQSRQSPLAAATYRTCAAMSAPVMDEAGLNTVQVRLTIIGGQNWPTESERRYQDNRGILTFLFA